MTGMNFEKRGPLWPWFLAAIIVLLLIWLLIKAFDVGVEPAPTTATTPATTADPAQGSSDPAMDPSAAPGAITAAGAGTERFAGTYGSGSTQLALAADGTYSMQEGPAGDQRGTWTHDAGGKALHLKPDDGSEERHLRIESNDTLLPLDAAGAPAGQMPQLTRQDAQ